MVKRLKYSCVPVVDHRSTRHISKAPDESESKIKHLISSLVPEVGTDFVIERAHRVGGPRSDSKPRKIVARFLNYKDREAVFKA